MVKSIVSFENLYEYDYFIKKGKILCEGDDMLMEIFGSTYGRYGNELPISTFIGTREYLSELSGILGDEDYDPIDETLGGESLLWVQMKNDTVVLGGNPGELYANRELRLIVHVDRLEGSKLHLSALQVEILG